MTLPCAASRLIAASLLTLLCAGTVAQQTPRDAPPDKPTTSKYKPIFATWEKEPDAFMGIKFGESFTAQVPECPKDTVGYDRWAIHSSHNRCFRSIAMQGNKRAFFLENSPDIGFEMINVSPTVVDGDFEGLSFSYFHYAYSKVSELFRARYGDPTLITNQHNQTVFGASLTGTIYTWWGKNVTIRVEEYGSKLDEGWVSIYTKKSTESTKAEAGKDAERNKDKL